jgi:hypothetical protein
MILYSVILRHDDGNQKLKSGRGLYWRNHLLGEERIPFSARKTQIFHCQYGSEHKRKDKEEVMSYLASK